MLKSVKVRIYPNATQRGILETYFNHTRGLWNWALRKSIWDRYAAEEAGEKAKAPTKFSLSYWFVEVKKTPEGAWMKEIPARVAKEVFGDLESAYKHFFRRVRNGESQPGFPNFKGRYSRRSFTHTGTIRVSDCGRYVKIPPKEFGWLRMRGWRDDVNGKLKRATVEHTASGKWNLSILVDDGEQEPSAKNEGLRVIGLDVGIKRYLAGFDGKSFFTLKPNPDLLQAEENLLRKQRKLSRKDKNRKPGEKHSNNREKARVLVAKAHERTAATRRDWIDKLAATLTEKYDVIVVEDLNIKQMMQDPSLAKSIANAGWSMLITKLEQKTKEKGGILVKIDRFFPSSKTCSTCGTIKKSLALSERKWTCEHCGADHERDMNAAKNIYNEGVKKLSADGRSVAATGGYSSAA